MNRSEAQRARWVRHREAEMAGEAQRADFLANRDRSLPGRCGDCQTRLYLDMSYGIPHWVDESGHPHRCRLGK